MAIFLQRFMGPFKACFEPAQQRFTLQRARDDIVFSLASVLMAFLLLAACAEEKTATPAFHAEENPARLSDWGMLKATGDELVISAGVTPYDLATPLFSDYALKLRTVWTPEGAPAQYDPNGVFDFPVGTVITKTFYYPTLESEWTGDVVISREHSVNDGAMALDHLRLIETRILVRRETGWEALPYIWNDEQTEAVLKRTGDVMPMTLHRGDGRTERFGYLVPNANQCAGCHATDATAKTIAPIGLKARHLNKTSSFAPAFNQLDHWLTKGLVTGEFSGPAPRNAVWSDESAPVAERARAYLDANCSHCHNPAGPADTSGLNLEPDANGAALGLCKTPIAAGTGTGGRRFSIVPGEPEASILVFRMETDDPGAMMPELGRAVMHEEGVALVSEWIAQMEGACHRNG